MHGCSGAIFPRMIAAGSATIFFPIRTKWRTGSRCALVLGGFTCGIKKEMSVSAAAAAEEWFKCLRICLWWYSRLRSFNTMGKLPVQQDRQDSLVLFTLMKRVEPKERTVLIKFLNEKGVDGFRNTLIRCVGRDGFAKNPQLRSKANILRTSSTKLSRRHMLMLHEELLDPLLDTVILALQEDVSAAQRRCEAAKCRKEADSDGKQQAQATSPDDTTTQTTAAPLLCTPVVMSQ